MLSCVAEGLLGLEVASGVSATVVTEEALVESAAQPPAAALAAGQDVLHGALPIEKAGVLERVGVSVPAGGFWVLGSGSDPDPDLFWPKPETQNSLQCSETLKRWCVYKHRQAGRH